MTEDIRRQVEEQIQIILRNDREDQLFYDRPAKIDHRSSKRLVEMGIAALPYIVELLYHEEDRVITRAVEIIRNIVRRSKEAIEDPKLEKKLVELMSQELVGSKRLVDIMEAFGTFKCRYAVKPLIERLSADDFGIRLRAIYALANAAEKGSEIDIKEVERRLVELVNKEPSEKQKRKVREEVLGYLSRIMKGMRKGKQGMQGVLSEGKPKVPVGSRRKLVRVRQTYV